MSCSHWGMFFGYYTLGHGVGVYSGTATYVACSPDKVKWKPAR